jgi:hypothetical protein
MSDPLKKLERFKQSFSADSQDDLWAGVAEAGREFMNRGIRLERVELDERNDNTLHLTFAWDRSQRLDVLEAVSACGWSRSDWAELIGQRFGE